MVTRAWFEERFWTSTMRGFKNLDCGIVVLSASLSAALLRIQLDDEALVDRGRQSGARWIALDRAFQAFGVHFHPFRQAARFRRLRGSLDAQLALRLAGDFDHVAGAHLVRRNVDALAVDQDAVMAHHLPRLGARGAAPHAIGHRGQPRFQQLQQALAGHALGARCLGVNQAELSLEDAVAAAHLLLLAKLLALVAHPPPAPFPLPPTPLPPPLPPSLALPP